MVMWLQLGVRGIKIVADLTVRARAEEAGQAPKDPAFVFFSGNSTQMPNGRRRVSGLRRLDRAQEMNEASLVWWEMGPHSVPGLYF